MNSSVIVEQFDPLSNIGPRFLACRVHHAMHPLVLQACGKRFRERVVPTLTGPPDRMPQPEFDQFLPVFARRVLRAAVGMHNAIRLEPPVAQRHCHRVEHELGAHVVGHRVPDHLAGAAVDQRSQIQPALPCSDVGDVADDLGSRSLGGEVALDQVDAAGGLRVRLGGGAERPGLHWNQAHLAHELANQLRADPFAGAHEFGVDAAVAVGAVESLEQGTDLLGEQLAAPLGGADRPAPPLVEAGLGHLQQRAHPRDRRELCRLGGGALRIDELEFIGHRCSLAKCAAAFFRKAFSIYSSRVRRSSSRHRARSDNSSGGSSAACAARYFFTQPPTVVSLSPYSRATSAIDRLDSTMSLATSSRNEGLYFVYFPVNFPHPFRIGPYLVRSPEGGRHAAITWQRNLAAINNAGHLDGLYALATNLPDPGPSTELTALDVLRIYKDQWVIEQRHRDLKQTLRVRPVFLHNDDRIEALIAVIGIALLIFGLIEAELRAALGDGVPLPGILPEGRAAKPTARAALAAFDGMHATYTQTGPVLDRLTQAQRIVLALLGIALPWPENAEE